MVAIGLLARVALHHLHIDNHCNARQLNDRLGLYTCVQSGHEAKNISIKAQYNITQARILHRKLTHAQY